MDAECCCDKNIWLFEIVRVYPQARYCSRVFDKEVLLSLARARCQDRTTCSRCLFPKVKCTIGMLLYAVDVIDSKRGYPSNFFYFYTFWLLLYFLANIVAYYFDS